MKNIVIRWIEVEARLLAAMGNVHRLVEEAASAIKKECGQGVCTYSLKKRFFEDNKSLFRFDGPWIVAAKSGNADCYWQSAEEYLNISINTAEAIVSVLENVTPEVVRNVAESML